MKINDDFRRRLIKRQKQYRYMLNHGFLNRVFFYLDALRSLQLLLQICSRRLRLLQTLPPIILVALCIAWYNVILLFVTALDVVFDEFH